MQSIITKGVVASFLVVLGLLVLPIKASANAPSLVISLSSAVGGPAPNIYVSVVNNCDPHNVEAGYTDYTGTLSFPPVNGGCSPGGFNCTTSPMHISFFNGDGSNNTTDVYLNNGNATQYIPLTYYPARSCDPSLAPSTCSNAFYANNYGEYVCPGSQAAVCNGSNTCQGQTVSGTCGSTCAGTIAPACVNNTSICGGICDTTAPSVSILNPPTDTCYRSATGTNGTLFSTTEPIQVKVDDTRGGTVVSSGIGSVSVSVTSFTTNSVTKTVPTSGLISGSATNGVYSVTIPQDATTFPTNGGRYSITAYASDNASHTSNSAAYPFTYDATGVACVTPHIQTQNGDVHSQGSVGQ